MCLKFLCYMKKNWRNWYQIVLLTYSLLNDCKFIILDHTKRELIITTKNRRFYLILWLRKMGWSLYKPINYIKIKLKCFLWHGPILEQVILPVTLAVQAFIMKCCNQSKSRFLFNTHTIHIIIRILFIIYSQL